MVDRCTCGNIKSEDREKCGECQPVIILRDPNVVLYEERRRAIYDDAVPMNQQSRRIDL